MGITKRKDGRYQGWVEIPTLTGERKRKYVYDKDRQECRRKLRELEEEVEQFGTHNVNKFSFKQYAQIWLDTYCKNLSPTTINGYKKSVFTYAAPYIGDAAISKILPIHIQEMLNDFSKTHSEKTCRNMISDINGVFKYAIMNRSLRFNPCDGVRYPKDIEPYKYYIYSEEEYNELLDKTTGTKFEIPVLLAGLCGLRVSEIMALTWNDINFSTSEIHIRKANVHVNGSVIPKSTKTRTSYRTIIAPAYVISRLSLYKNVGLVCPKSNGEPEHGGNFGKRFSRFLKNNKLPHTRFHDLRHFNATMMLDKGVPDKIAAANLGHSDTNMTKKYQHILSNMRNSPADILNTIVSKRDVKMDVKRVKTGL